MTKIIQSHDFYFDFSGIHAFEESSYSMDIELTATCANGDMDHPFVRGKSFINIIMVGIFEQEFKTKKKQ